MRRKNDENIFFTAVSNSVQITCGTQYRHAIRRVSIIQPSLFYFSLRISYSLNGALYQNGTNLIFIPLVDFGSSWKARTKLLLSGLDMTLFTALHTCDMSRPVTWIRPIYRLFAHLGFFNLRGMYWDKKRGKIWRQLPFKFFCWECRQPWTGKTTLWTHDRKRLKKKYMKWIQN